MQYKKDKTIVVRCCDELKNGLEKKAAKEKRSFSDYMRLKLWEILNKK